MRASLFCANENYVSAILPQRLLSGILLLSLSLSLFLAECGREGKAIFNAGRELSCRGSLYLLDRSSFFAPLSAHSWRIQ